MNDHEELRKLALSYLDKMQEEVNVFRTIAAHITNDLSDQELYSLIGASSVLESLAHECRLAIQEIELKCIK